MLYVFLVDTGTMLHLDMNLALESVENLKENIARMFKVPVDKQVLLISGGESLDTTARVCSYSAGTDTNPIYLFSKSAIECAIPPTPTSEYSPDIDLNDQVDNSADLPATYQTIVIRTQIAQEFYDQARNLIQDCERLVHEQHLQQQGWAAVVANLEDITQSFCARAERFEDAYSLYLKSRNENIELLKNFHEDLKLLSEIPILPALLGYAKEKCADESLSENYSLLQWISSKDNKSSLEEMAANCERGLSLMDCALFDVVQKEIKAVVDDVNNQSMKEVKGLEDRLYGLDQLMHESMAVVREQGDQAQALLQNQSRLNTTSNDPSVYHELCLSHRRQMHSLQKNHQRLQDIRRRCGRAKEELASNLHTRLRWIMYVERNMCDVDNKFVFYHECMKRVTQNMGILQQVHLTPALYLETVAEVVRRRFFAKLFLQSATVLSRQATQIYDKEMEMRKGFMAKLSNHFLQSLFSGMNDYPPPFAAQTPPSFDMNLPPLVCDDIETLRTILPNMGRHLQFTVSSPTFWTPEMIECVASSSVQASAASRTDLALDAGSQVQMLEVSCMEGNFAQTPSRKQSDEGLSPDDKSSKSYRMLRQDEEEPKEQPESEAETEDFEKVDKISEPLERVSDEDYDNGISEAKQRKLERSSSSVRWPAKSSAVCVQDRAVSTDDCAEELVVVSSSTEELKEQKSKLAQLNITLQAICKLSCETTNEMKSDLFTIKQEVFGCKTEISKHVERLTMELQKVFVDVSTKVTAEQEEVLNSTISALQAEHQDLADELRQKLEVNSGKLQEAVQQVENYERQLNDASSQFDISKQQFSIDMERLRVKLETDRQEDVKRLSLEHELELDGTKEELKAVMEAKEAEIRNLTEMRQDLEAQVKLWKCKYESLEEQLRCQFQHEKDEVLLALETSYMEREASAISKAKEEGERKLETLISGLKEEYEEKLKEQLKVQEAAASEKMDMPPMITEEQLQSTASELNSAMLEEQHVRELSQLREAATKELEEAIACAKLNAVANEEAREMMLRAETAECLRIKEMDHLQEMTAVYRKLDEEKQRSLREQEEKMHHIAAANALREELEATIGRCREEQETKLQQLRDSLLQEHRSDMDSLRSRFRMCVSTTGLPMGSGNSLSAPVSPVGLSPTDEQPMHKSLRFQESVDDEFHHLKMQSDIEKCPHHSEAWTNALDELKQKHQEETLALMQAMKLSHQEQLSAMRASLMGERQANFNEAVNRVIREKDEIIEQLRMKQKVLLVQLKEDSQELEMLRTDECYSSVESQHVVSAEAVTRALKGYHKFDVVKADERGKFRRTKRLSIIPLPTDAAGGLTVSVAPVADQERILELEQNLRSKQEEVSRLQHQLMELSMSTSNTTLVPQDKVSILSCNVGDVVLLCYDESHENYLVFLVCPIYHFVHTDCLEVLGLTSGPGETRKTWTLAEVTNKEYCQTKKAQNRYRVPLGTKVCRVKAKPWTRESSLVREEPQASASSAASEGAIATAPTQSSSSRRSSSCPSPTNTSQQ